MTSLGAGEAVGKAGMVGEGTAAAEESGRAIAGGSGSTVAVGRRRGAEVEGAGVVVDIEHAETRRAIDGVHFLGRRLRSASK
jgi:hypothetical protein